MEEKRWESCNAEALLEEFFSQDDLRQLALSTGELLGCPLLVLDDTFHIAAHHLPLGFSDALFETAVRRGEISYEAGAIISRNPMLTAGWADYVQLADSPYRCEVTDALLAEIDVLVDGPFIEAEKSLTLNFRGSANQRILYLREKHGD